MRLISFSLTTPQIRRRVKTVTRRTGWKTLRPGARLQAVEQAMGLRKGQTVTRLAVIEVTEVSHEPLRRMVDEPAYGRTECVAEGFPHLTPAEFVAMFCASHKGCTPDTVITRIGFRYREGA
jgi:hypothetical protein